MAGSLKYVSRLGVRRRRAARCRLASEPLAACCAVDPPPMLYGNRVHRRTLKWKSCRQAERTGRARSMSAIRHNWFWSMWFGCFHH